MPFDVQRVVGGSALILLAAVITLVGQGWVGGTTIYHDDLQERRLAVHESILENRPIEDSWEAQGGNRTNIRIVTILIAEGADRLLNIPVDRAYRALDTVCLFAFLLLLYAFLRRWVPPAGAVAGILYFGAVLPLTYYLHYFHPWDRLSALLWLSLLWAVRDDRYAILAVLLPVTVAVKFDAVVVAGLYWLVWVNSTDLVRTTGRSLLLGFLALGTYIGLRLALPGGFEANDIAQQVARNVTVALRMNVLYPPLLMFVLPIFLAAIGFTRGDRFVRVCAPFGLALFAPLFLTTNFIEVRAHIPVLLLLLPAAALGANQVLALAATLPDEREARATVASGR